MTVALLPLPRDPLGDRASDQVAQEAVHQAQALGLLRQPPSSPPSVTLRCESAPRVVRTFGLGADSGFMSQLPPCR
ncbi:MULTISPECIES: hypothetical protein [unclassified Crossiella]|uniref:hypothetical protein n=1 Tax=unclassified Crossiella TaxID=2620835 RepID=UPI001FFF9D56|nr:MULTISPECIES: hypothetical protein [unclassified Crossiella]MCK2240045.1 hypothetical protein [Crossiella sp. S99.2]MCK2252753.1 hypothetical protein [Crossiella sp. S99.1]